MKEINLIGLNEVVYEEQLDNGFRVYIWKSEKAKSFEGDLTVNYGADALEFYIKKKKYTVHRGSAHYLEHMVCESDIPMLEKFNKLGSYSNAFTNNLQTTYKFIGTKNIKDNIKLLLQNVLETKITKDAIESGRNPILEERRMREDNPNVVSYFTLNKMLYHSIPNSIDIIGSESDIKEIDEEELNLIYHTFYHPSNMFLVVTGNVDPYEVVSSVKEYFKEKKEVPFLNPILKKYREKKTVVIKEQEIHSNIEMPEVIFNVKIPIKKNMEEDILKIVNMIRLALTTNFGSTSLLKEELLEKKLITTLYFSAYRSYNFIIVELGCRSKYPEEVIPILKNRLLHLELFSDDLKRKIKSIIATLVLSYEDVEDVNRILTSFLVNEKRIVDNEKEIFEKIKIEEIEALFKELSFKEMAILTMLPNEK